MALQLPELELLWESAKEFRRLPESEEAQKKFFEDLKASRDLQKDLYIEILKAEIQQRADDEAFGK